MSAAPVVEAKNIVKELGQGAGMVQALKGVSVSLVPGELTLLMGPSGSGKTTLLSILGCILSQTSGSLTIAGNSTDGLGAEELAALRRRNIGFVFQSYNLFPTLTATENVKLALDVRGHSGKSATEMATTALKAVGLGHRLDAYPRSMSGGEQQRVAIARALAGSPAVILADEPTAALDSKNGLAVMALIQELSRDESRVVLAVTHDGRTLPYADRIITIEDGRIVDDRRQKPTAGPAATKAAAKTSKKKA
ncbi:MAG: ABC transporter ATP-binding protein [Hyphomicrobiaceae bacterium]